MDNIRDKTIEVKPIRKREIFFRILLQAVVYGGAAGGVGGLIFGGALAFPEGIIAGVPYGGLVGLVLGVINGIVLGIETICFYFPLVDCSAYRRRMLILSLVVSFMATAPVIQLFKAEFDGHSLGRYFTLLVCVLFYGLIAAGAVWVNRRIGKWYSSLWTDASSPAPTLNQGDSE